MMQGRRTSQEGWCSQGRRNRVTGAPPREDRLVKFRCPPRDLTWFEQMWRSRYAIANQALMAARKLHPDRKIAKAARAALMKANRSGTRPGAADRPALGRREPRRRRREEPELRVSLVGVSCVGTTTVGRILADRWGWPFFDLDEEIERHIGISIERLQARFLTGYSSHVAPIPPVPPPEGEQRLRRFPGGSGQRLPRSPWPTASSLEERIDEIMDRV